jgi:glycosyltransferase involved in cell wall biosynthesis
MGRLVPQKGFDLLLQAFARIPSASREGWNVCVLGEGPERSSLCELAQTLGIAEHVLMPGKFYNPMPILEVGDVFVLSSRFEGFGIALAEAMACGLPAVAFNCNYGPAEVIRNGINGLLIEPLCISAMAVALERLMTDEELRAGLGKNARAVRWRFSVENFLARWEALIEELMARFKLPAWPGTTKPAALVLDRESNGS